MADPGFGFGFALASVGTVEIGSELAFGSGIVGFGTGVGFGFEVGELGIETIELGIEVGDLVGIGTGVGFGVETVELGPEIVDFVGVGVGIGSGVTAVYDALLTLALIVVSALSLLCSYRVVRGPTTPDRVVALETIATNVVAIAALYALKTDRGFFISVALVLAIVGFVSTVAVARYVTEGDIVR